MQHMMMVIPEDAHIQEAKRISQKQWQFGLERGDICSGRNLQVEHHNGNDDGDHSIRERLEPLLTQC
jgi:hypothetical protein